MVSKATVGEKGNSTELKQKSFSLISFSSHPEEKKC